MLDRLTPPPSQKIGQFKIPEVQQSHLSNGRELFYIQHGDQTIFKLEFTIRSGSAYSSQYDLVPLTLKMLNESTKQRTGTQMANDFDSLGAFIEFNPGFDNTSISVFGLTKHFSKIIRLTFEILMQPKFDEKEFSELKKKEIQRIRLNEEKNNYLCSVQFRNSIFGKDHPYGRAASINELGNIQVTDVREFYDSNFRSFDILISGVLPKDFQSQLDELFGQASVPKVSTVNLDITPDPTKHLWIDKPHSVQSSLKIGKRLFNRAHPNYIKLLVTNELLGGFFGSRLMKNIREEKGLTYGIHSNLYALNHDGYFCISTDVKGEFTQQAVDEIFKEIESLQTQEVPQNELDTVKNYMLGTFSSTVATPFSLMDRFKAVHYQGLDYSYYRDYFDTLDEISSADLLTQSRQHLDVNSLSTCIVGPATS